MTAEAATADRNKATVRRLVEEVLNGGRSRLGRDLWLAEVVLG
jgi:hypothetical protein